MAEFICGGCVGEDGHRPGDPRPCGPLGNETDRWVGAGQETIQNITRRFVYFLYRESGAVVLSNTVDISPTSSH